MICPLCGHSFEESEMICKGCPMHAGCEVICCPNCHYQYAERSGTVEFFTNLYKKLTSHGTKRD